MSEHRATIITAQAALGRAVDNLVDQAGVEVRRRAYQTANELQNALNYVLRGQRHGRRYIIPGTGQMHYNRKSHTAKITYKRYIASAPGEPPAIRTGAFRMSWHRRTFAEELEGRNFNVHGVTESDLRASGKLLGRMLEEGTARMAPRPYQQRTIDRAMPRVMQIYRSPYFHGR